MQISRLVIVLTLLSLTLSLTGCGGGGSGSTGQAQGTTVALQAQVKTGSATIVFSQYTSAASRSILNTNPSMDFTLNSVINSNAGSMASDVNITSEVFTFEYIDSTPAIAVAPPNIPSLTYNSNLIVPAGGTTDWANVPVFTTIQKQFLFLNDPLSAGTSIIRYRVRATFNGYEVKNGSNISVSTTGTLILMQ